MRSIAPGHGFDTAWNAATAQQRPVTSAAPPAGVPDSRFLPAPLALLLATAQREIDRHTRDHGRCAACGQDCPCRRAILADLALSGL
jgi:hypothetical protein